ncbi:hypothetical protein [Haloterrigena salifodinae]|uniref:hypothetical protein n=1 Tax=Haloterrigena salifodinae TaxID=2675099 RepID=UPI000F85CCFD|nr:hypothetical protein [Haloterrigena salifodinae]
MKRRDFLAKTGAITTVLAGCLNGEGGKKTGEGEKDVVTYEQCASPPYVRTSSLPESAEVEILAAILNGEYKSSDNLVLP